MIKEGRDERGRDSGNHRFSIGRHRRRCCSTSTATSTSTSAPPLFPSSSPLFKQVVLPIGPVPPEALAAYTSLITRHATVQAQSLRSFYRSGGPGEGGGGGGGAAPLKSPFRSYPWKSGRLRLRYLPPQVPVPQIEEEEEEQEDEEEGEGEKKSSKSESKTAAAASPPLLLPVEVFRPPLAALHAHRKALGVIGICHCPSLLRLQGGKGGEGEGKGSGPSGLSKAHAAFERALLSYPDALAARLYAFEPSEAQRAEAAKAAERASASAAAAAAAAAATATAASSSSARPLPAPAVPPAPLRHLMAMPPTPATAGGSENDRANLLAGHAAVLAAELGAELLRGAERGMLSASAAGVSLATDADLCPDAAGAVAAAAAAQAAAAALASASSTPVSPTSSAAASAAAEDDATRRRRHCRLTKSLGDAALLAGSPDDAATHYAAAADLARSAGDAAWQSASLEGLAAAKVVSAAMKVSSSPPSSSFGEVARPAPPAAASAPAAATEEASRPSASSASSSHLSLFTPIDHHSRLLAAQLSGDAGPAAYDEVRPLLAEARAVCRRKCGVALRASCAARGARAAALLRGRGARALAVDVAAELSSSLGALTRPEDALAALAEAADVCGGVGLNRKRALLLWQAVELCRSWPSPDPAALEAARRALTPRGGSDSDGDDDCEEGGEEESEKVKKVFKGLTSRWPAVRCGALEGVLSASIALGDHGAVWDAAAALLRRHGGSGGVFPSSVASPAPSASSATLGRSPTFGAGASFSGLPPARQDVLARTLDAAAAQMSSEEREARRREGKRGKEGGAGPPPLVAFVRAVPPGPALRPRLLSNPPSPCIVSVSVPAPLPRLSSANGAAFAPHCSTPSSLGGNNKGAGGNGNSGPFIYSALLGGREELEKNKRRGGGGGGGGKQSSSSSSTPADAAPELWAAGDVGVASVEVEVCNPTAVALQVERLTLAAEFLGPVEAGGGGEETPAAAASSSSTKKEAQASSPSPWQPAAVSMWLPPFTPPTVVTLTGTAAAAGTYRFVGCRLSMRGVSWLARWRPRRATSGSGSAGSGFLPSPAIALGLAKRPRRFPGTEVGVCGPLPRLRVLLEGPNWSEGGKDDDGGGERMNKNSNNTAASDVIPTDDVPNAPPQQHQQEAATPPGNGQGGGGDGGALPALATFGPLLRGEVVSLTLLLSRDAKASKEEKIGRLSIAVARPMLQGESASAGAAATAAAAAAAASAESSRGAGAAAPAASSSSTSLLLRGAAARGKPIPSRSVSVSVAAAGVAALEKALEKQGEGEGQGETEGEQQPVSVAVVVAPTAEEEEHESSESSGGGFGDLDVGLDLCVSYSGPSKGEGNGGKEGGGIGKAASAALVGRAAELKARLRFRGSLAVSRLSLVASRKISSGSSGNDCSSPSSSSSSSSSSVSLVAEVSNESPFPLRAWIGLRREWEQEQRLEPPGPPPSSSVVIAGGGNGSGNGSGSVCLPAFPLDPEALLPSAASSGRSLETLRASPEACLSSSLALFWKLEEGGREGEEEGGGGRKGKPARRGALPLPARLLSAALSGRRGKAALDALAPAAVHVKVEPLPPSGQGGENGEADGNSAAAAAAAAAGPSSAAALLLCSSPPGKLPEVRALVGVPLSLSLVAARRQRAGGEIGGGGEEAGEAGGIEVEVGLRTRAVPSPPSPPSPSPPPVRGESGDGEQQRRRRRPASSAPPPPAAFSSSSDDDEDEEGSDPSVVATGVVEGMRLSLPPATEKEDEARQRFSLTFLSEGTFAVEPRGVVARKKGTKGGEGTIVDSSSEALYVIVE